MKNGYFRIYPIFSQSEGGLRHLKSPGMFHQGVTMGYIVPLPITTWFPISHSSLYVYWKIMSTIFWSQPVSHSQSIFHHYKVPLNSYKSPCFNHFWSQHITMKQLKRKSPETISFSVYWRLSPPSLKKSSIPGSHESREPVDRKGQPTFFFFFYGINLWENSNGIIVI